MPRVPAALACNVSVGRRQRQWSSLRAGGGPCLFACVHFSIVALECRRAVPDLDMSYNYVVTAQKPTAVNGCVTGEAAGAGDPAREGAGGNRGLGRPAAPGAAGRDRVPGMEGTGGRRSSPQPTTLKKQSSARAFWGAEAALEGPLSSWEVTWPRGQGRVHWDREQNVN